MKIITLKWENNCGKCDKLLEVGQKASYEKITGIFCPEHFPTDPEEIREYRTEKAEAKAERLDGWAQKRRKKASDVFESDREILKCNAFCTQPGHIPERARLNARQDRENASLDKADAMEERADGIRNNVRVKGDAARADEKKRLYIKERIKVGMIVETPFSQVPCEILKINKNTVKLKGQFGNFNEQIHFLKGMK
ncbi:MAG: hypothetical protein KAJ48_04765 [Elusimicrobiales bacterium]|nr:hypothetical protein [Elusimicrobiales bacterium]